MNNGNRTEIGLSSVNVAASIVADADKRGNDEIKADNLSFQEYRAFIRDKFIEGSGILPCLVDQLDFCSQLEFEAGGDVSTPIADRLNWDGQTWKRFTHNANVNRHAAFLRNEDGCDWQAILNIPKDGKSYQYLAPKETGDVPFLPVVPFEVRVKVARRFNLSIGGEGGIPVDGSFWDWVADANVPVCITEGGKKALALLSLGIPAIALFGISCGVAPRDNAPGFQLKDAIKRFIRKDRVVVVAMDNDSNGNDLARRNNKMYKSRLIQAIQDAEAKPRLMSWSADYKGVDDLIVSNKEAFDFSWMGALFPQSKSKISKMVSDLEYRFGSRLRFNELSQQIEIDSQELDLDVVKVFWGETFGEDASSENIIQSLLSYSKKNSYNPVRDWLLGIENGTSPSESFHQIASLYLGSEDDLANIYLRKTMIGAVARAFSPGVKLDTCTVLQGRQGLGKSSFWAALAGSPQFFDDSLSAHGGGDKDEKLKISRFWFLELAELESLYRRKDVSSVRSLLSSSSDNIRLPYGRTIKSFPRHSIFVGSVNPADFLADAEGNRRFWVIPVSEISIPSPEEVRGLWAAAIQAYRSGETWWLSQEEEDMQRSHNKNFEQSDPWEHQILSYASNHEYVGVSEILSEGLQIPLAMQSKREEMRVSDVLRRAGYSRSTKRVSGRLLKVWGKVVTEVVTGVVTSQTPVAASIPADESTNQGTEVVTEVVTSQTPVTASIPADKKSNVTTVTTFLDKNKNHTEINEETNKAQSPNLCMISNFADFSEEVVTPAESHVQQGFKGVTTPKNEDRGGNMAENHVQQGFKGVTTPKPLHRLNFPVLVKGREYQIKDGDRWIAARFIRENIQDFDETQKYVHSLIFRYFSREIEVLNINHIKD